MCEETFYPVLCVVVPDARPDPELLDAAIAFLNANKYGLRNSLWANDPDVVERFTSGTTNSGVLKVNDSHLAYVPYLPVLGGTGLSSGVHGGAGYPFVRASRLQGVAIATTRTHPREPLLRGATAP